jgi:hypothetical protein
LANANIDDDQYVTFAKRIIDQVSVTDGIYKYVGKILQDIANVSDQKYLSANTVQTDQTKFTDILNLFKYRNQFNFEQINVSNSGTTYLHNYFENSTYADINYVGTTKTFT